MGVTVVLTMTIVKTGMSIPKLNTTVVVAQWQKQSPHSKVLTVRPFCVEFAYSPHICLGLTSVLIFPHSLTLYVSYNYFFFLNHSVKKKMNTRRSMTTQL